MVRPVKISRNPRPSALSLTLALAAACVTLPFFWPGYGWGGGGSRAEMVIIPAGKFTMGSLPEDREFGYKLDETRHKSSVARQKKWFENETRREVNLPAYRIDKYLVTNADYQEFVNATERDAPYVSQRVWESYGLIHKYKTVRKFLWKGGRYPAGRSAHPVVLVSHEDAEAFCKWRGQQEGRNLRPPTEEEWEKAARGSDARRFPWGNEFDPERLNSYEGGPYDTVPVGRYPMGASPYGIMDMAGMVFEWTSTPLGQDGRFIVKGGSWDDYPGVTRSAARHGRPATLKHILIGFRCAGPISP